LGNPSYNSLRMGKGSAGPKSFLQTKKEMGGKEGMAEDG